MRWAFWADWIHPLIGKNMSAQGLLREIVVMLGGAVCVGLPMALVII
jgi:hypothetical protein